MLGVTDVTVDEDIWIFVASQYSVRACGHMPHLM